MLILGSHVSFGPEQLLGATKEALSYGANTFMFYTGAPTNTIRKDINNVYIEEAMSLMKDNDILIENVVCHAPYIVNLANKSDLSKYDFSINFIKKELQRCDAMQIKQMVLHPGSAVGISKEEGLHNIVEALNCILDGTTKCRILLETMAGKGSECGATIEEIAFLVNHTIRKEQIGICLDTCHLHDAGYDMSHFDAYLDALGNLVDLSYIGCIHINDSKNEKASHKDRHANIGKGHIGFSNLITILNNDKLASVPKILETPYIGDTDEAKERIYPPYKYEIEMLRNKEYDEDCFQKIRDSYKKV